MGTRWCDPKRCASTSGRRLSMEPMVRTFTIDEAVAVLERTPAALDALLRGLPDRWTGSNEGPNTFSPYDVIGHLIHGEKTDWIVRARIILDHGEARPFDRYDRFAQARESA